MRLAGATRAADAAVWRRSDLGAYSGDLRRVPPVLAVEVAGTDDTEEILRDKARWYLAVGVPVVWLVIPSTREVVVVTGDGETRHRGDDTVPAGDALAGFAPRAAEFFLQLGPASREAD